MCYVSPGPRCSSHAQKKLDKLRSSRDNVRGEIRVAYTEYKAVVEVFRENPEDKAVAVKAKRLHREVRSLKEKESNIAEKIRLAQRDFDGTRKGQQLLKEQLASFDKENGDFEDYAEMTNRLSSGKMLYSWRKNQLNLRQEEARTGKNVKERRGKFLSLADRFESDVIELDPEVIDAVSKVRVGRGMALV